MSGKFIGKLLVVGTVATCSFFGLTTKSNRVCQIVQASPYVQTITTSDTGLVVNESDIGSTLHYVLRMNLKEEGKDAPTVLYSNSFQGKTTLNLNIQDWLSGTDATYALGLSGLKKFDLSTITSIDLSNCGLKEFDVDVFTNNGEQRPNVTSINLSNNELTSISFSAVMPKLQNIDLHNNQLTSVEMKSLIASQINVNLSNNLIKSVDDVQLPFNSADGIVSSPTKVMVNLSHNMIDLVNDDIILSGVNRTYYYGVQKWTNFKYTSSQELIYQSIENLKSYVFQVTKNEEDEIISSTQFLELEGTDTFNKVTLPVGSYEMRFYDTIQNVWVDETTQKDVGYYTFEFDILPNKPTLAIYVKGKVYTDYDKVIVGRPQFKATSGQGQLYYSLSGGDWKKMEDGQTIDVDLAGNISIRIKNVENGVDSEIVSVSLQTSLNPYVSDVILLVILIIGMILLGVVGVPLIKKYLVR